MPHRAATRTPTSLDGFKARYVSAGRGEGRRKSVVNERLRDASGDLALQLCRVALKPFRYKRNGRIHVTTDEFCDGLDREVVLKLRRHAGQPFFSLE